MDIEEYKAIAEKVKAEYIAIVEKARAEQQATCVKAWHDLKPAENGGEK